MFITEASEDPRFNDPFVDIDEERTDPVPHRYVHGGFTGTDAKFSFYFPPADRYEQRFFQPTHQLFFSEHAQDPTITFTLESGAYLVQSNMGGSEYPRSAGACGLGQVRPDNRGLPRQCGGRQVLAGEGSRVVRGAPTVRLPPRAEWRRVPDDHVGRADRGRVGRFRAAGHGVTERDPRRLHRAHPHAPRPQGRRQVRAGHGRDRPGGKRRPVRRAE